MSRSRVTRTVTRRGLPRRRRPPRGRDRISSSPNRPPRDGRFTSPPLRRARRACLFESRPPRPRAQPVSSRRSTARRARRCGTLWTPTRRTSGEAPKTKKTGRRKTRRKPRRRSARSRGGGWRGGARSRSRRARRARARRAGRRLDGVAPQPLVAPRATEELFCPHGGLAAPGDLYRPRGRNENGVADDDDAAALDAEKTRVLRAVFGDGPPRTNERTTTHDKKRTTTGDDRDILPVSSRLELELVPAAAAAALEATLGGRVRAPGCFRSGPGTWAFAPAASRGVRERHRAFGTAEGLEGLPVGGAANPPLRIPGRLRAARPGLPGGVRARRRRPRRGDRRQTRAFSVGRKCRPRAGARGAPDAFGPRKRPRASRENQHTARARRRSRERGEAAGSAAAFSVGRTRRRRPPPARPRRPRVFACRGPRLHGVAREAAAAREARDPPAGHVAVLRDVQARRRERTRSRRARGAGAGRGV